MTQHVVQILWCENTYCDEKKEKSQENENLHHFANLSVHSILHRQ